MEKVNVTVRLQNAYTGEEKETTIQVFKSLVALVMANDLTEAEELAHFLSLGAVVSTILNLPSNDDWDEDGEWMWVEVRTENGETIITF